MNRIPSLDDLDPARREPGYWHRLHRTIVVAAGPELARRRALAGPSVPVLVLEWSRTVVPTALLAATVAGLLLLRGVPDAPVGADVASGPETGVVELLEGGVGDFMESFAGSAETVSADATVWFAEGGF